MIGMKMIRYAAAAALGSLLLASAALAGPQMTFGPENQGTLKLDYKGQFQVVARDIGSGFANEENTYNFNFRRNRLALMGTYGEVMSLYVQTEFTEDPTVTTLGVAAAEPGSTFQMLDAVVRFNFMNEFKLSVGKFKYNLSRENLEACENPLTLDRSLFIRAPFVTTRDMGVAVWGNLYKDMFQYRADMMEGRKAVAFSASPKSDFRFSARGHVSLFDPENEYGYKGTYMGEKKVFTLGAAVQYEPNLIFDDTVAPLAAKSYLGWTADYFFEYPIEGIGTPTISGAYEKVDFDDTYLQQHPDLGSIGIDGQKNGYYVKAGYLMPKMPLQVFGRYEKWRFALLDNVYDQGIDWMGGGVNYYFRGQNLKVTAEVSNTSFDKKGTFSGVQGTSLRTMDFNTFTGQLQIVF
jgi:hypothetical protein